MLPRCMSESLFGIEHTDGFIAFSSQAPWLPRSGVSIKCPKPSPIPKVTDRRLRHRISKTPQKTGHILRSPTVLETVLLFRRCSNRLTSQFVCSSRRYRSRITARHAALHVLACEVTLALDWVRSLPGLATVCAPI
jgi:hypothetical protein